MRGGDLYRLREVLGHADIQTTMIYAHLRPEALLEEIEKCLGNGRAPKDDRVGIREMLEALQTENRFLPEKLEREVHGEKNLIPSGPIGL